MHTSFQIWFERFLEEKDLPTKNWEIEKDGEMHFIDSTVVIEAIMNCNSEEQKKIKQTIVTLDFYNSPILDYFEHLAKGLISNY